MWDWRVVRGAEGAPGECRFVSGALKLWFVLVLLQIANGGLHTAARGAPWHAASPSPATPLYQLINKVITGRRTKVMPPLCLAAGIGVLLVTTQVDRALQGQMWLMERVRPPLLPGTAIVPIPAVIPHTSLM